MGIDNLGAMRKLRDRRCLLRLSVEEPRVKPAQCGGAGLTRFSGRADVENGEDGTGGAGPDGISLLFAGRVTGETRVGIGGMGTADCA